LLVAEARKAGLSAVGVEPSAALVNAARQTQDIDLLPGTFPHPQLTDRRFELIFLVDVIEHVSDPVDLLRSCADSLSEEGLLVVVTPDARSLAARMLRRRWWHFRLAHVGYFDRHTLRMAGENAGLAIERYFRAKWFFPISYLAERLEQYLPLRWWNRLAGRVSPLRWLYRQVVPLDLRDSWVVFFVRDRV
jgi:SAM-dependent methyltransferase